MLTEQEVKDMLRIRSPDDRRLSTIFDSKPFMPTSMNRLR